MLVAQAAQDLGTSSGLLWFLLGGGLIAMLVSVYRFVVNFRMTERGMTRWRIQQAKKDERAAQWEAGLWQARSADLEYLIRSEIGPARIPPLSDELRKLIEQNDAEANKPAAVDWNIAPPPARNPGGGPGT